MRRALPYILVFFLGFLVCAWVIYRFFGTPGAVSTSTYSGPAPGGVSLIKPGTNQVRDAAKLVSDYVVNIDTIGRPQSRPGFFPFEPSQEFVPKGQASGVIFTPDGYIITNSHVVDGAATLNVTTRSGRKYSAKLIGRDPRSDLAVIKIDASNLRYATFADSSKYLPGDWVIAVGSPLGFDWTVTLGVISATKRGPIQVGNRTLTDAIQTDAAINPGNSGGALADLNAKLLGINTMISSPSGGSVGIGFAIPSNTAERVAKELIKHGKIVHPYLGIRYVPYNPEVRKQLEEHGLRGLPKTEGILIGEVYQGSPAADAGLRPDDIITRINGKQISGTGSAVGRKVTLSDEISKAKVGQRITLEVWHAGSRQTGTVAVTIGEMPENLGG